MKGRIAGFIFYFIILVIFAVNINPQFTLAASGLADSPWPMFHGNSKLTGLSKYDTSAVDGTLKWKFKADKQIESSPVVGADGTIYIADQSCNLYAVNPDGRQKWKFDAGEPVTSKEWGGESCFQSTPAIAADGTIYILPTSGNFYAVNSDGSEKWRYPVFAFKNVWTSPAIASDGTIYVGSESYPPKETGQPQKKNALIYALNPDGTLKWSYDTGGNWSTSTPAIADDGTFYTTANDCSNNCKNTIFAFNPDGKIKWKFAPDGIVEGSASIGIDGTIYIGVKGEHNPKDGKFYALTPEGKEKWKIALTAGMSVTPGIAKNGTIYIGDWDGNFFAFGKDGKQLWTAQTPKSFETLSSSPAIGADGTIYFGSMASTFFAFNPDGTEKWNYKFTGGGIVATPAIGSDGTVYAATVPGELLAFGNSTQSSASAISKNFTSKTIFGIKLSIVIILEILVLIFLIALAIYLKKQNKLGKYWIIFIILILSIAVITALFSKSNPKNKTDATPAKGTSVEEMFKFGEDFEKICPDKITLDPASNSYIATLGDKEWKVPNLRQIDWISESCPNTIWPNKNSAP